jgi:hypothetical protein
VTLEVRSIDRIFLQAHGFRMPHLLKLLAAAR